jgi:hypothetical protein
MKDIATLTTDVRSVTPLLHLTAAGALLVAAAGVLIDPAVGWSSALTGALFGLSLVLGTLFFIAINAVTGARWWLPAAPATGLVGCTFVVPAGWLLLTVSLGMPALYPWADHALVEASHLLHSKVAWLNGPFFLARAAIVLVIFALFSRVLLPAPTGAAPSLPSVRAGAAFLVLGAVALSVGYWDWVMSLEPEWFSTMFAVYGFAGCFQGGIAAVTLVALWLERRGTLHLGPGARHDLGKLLFAFSMFWAYIWFCQYMLIWYSNIPEETGYFATRLSGGWGMVFWLNPLVTFVAPFLLLLPAAAKRRAGSLAQAAGVVLVGRWLDTYIMIAPSASASPEVPVYAVAATLAVVLGMLIWARRSAGAA